MAGRVARAAHAAAPQRAAHSAVAAARAPAAHPHLLVGGAQPLHDRHAVVVLAHQVLHALRGSYRAACSTARHALSHAAAAQPVLSCPLGCTQGPPPTRTHTHPRRHWVHAKVLGHGGGVEGVDDVLLVVRRQRVPAQHVLNRGRRLLRQRAAGGGGRGGRTRWCGGQAAPHAARHGGEQHACHACPQRRRTSVGFFSEAAKTESTRCASSPRGCAPLALVSSILVTWRTTFVMQRLEGASGASAYKHSSAASSPTNDCHRHCSRRSASTSDSTWCGGGQGSRGAGQAVRARLQWQAGAPRAAQAAACLLPGPPRRSQRRSPISSPTPSGSPSAARRPRRASCGRRWCRRR